MKNLFKYLSIAAIAGTIGLMTTNAATDACAADEEVYTNYYMFLNVDTKNYFETELAKVTDPSKSLTFYNAADKANNLKGQSLLKGQSNYVKIVQTGTTGEDGGQITWTLEDFWKKYYTAKTNENAVYVYSDKNAKENYIMHEKWWKYPTGFENDGVPITPISANLKNKLLERIKNNWSSLASDDLLTKGTLIPDTLITVPSDLETSGADTFHWRITRMFKQDTYVPDGVNLDNSTVIYSPSVYYIKYCAKKTGTTTPTDPDKKFTVKYDANGGKGAPASQEGTPSSCVSISNQKPTKEGLNFLGWSANSNASTPDKQYEAGKPYCGPNDITLYAVYSTTNKPTGISSHLIVFSVIALGAAGALVVAKKKNLFKQI